MIKRIFFLLILTCSLFSYTAPVIEDLIQLFNVLEVPIKKDAPQPSRP